MRSSISTVNSVLKYIFARSKGILPLTSFGHSIGDNNVDQYVRSPSSIVKAIHMIFRHLSSVRSRMFILDHFFIISRPFVMKVWTVSERSFFSSMYSGQFSYDGDVISSHLLHRLFGILSLLNNLIELSFFFSMRFVKFRLVAPRFLMMVFWRQCVAT